MSGLSVAGKQTKDTPLKTGMTAAVPAVSGKTVWSSKANLEAGGSKPHLLCLLVTNGL